MSEKVTLLIEKLEFEAIIGLLESERQTPQKVSIEAKIVIDYKKNSLVDYAEICQVIENEIKSKKFLTVEEALEGVSKRISKISPQIRKIYLKILKPTILQNAVVGASCKKFFKKI